MLQITGKSRERDLPGPAIALARDRSDGRVARDFVPALDSAAVCCEQCRELGRGQRAAEEVPLLWPISSFAKRCASRRRATSWPVCTTGIIWMRGCLPRSRFIARRAEAVSLCAPDRHRRRDRRGARKTP